MTSRLRWTISLLAILGAVPYLTLKVAWLSGSRVGLLEPDFGHSPVMYAANAVTLFLDLAAVALALAFVMPWGRRLRSSWMLLPMWVGTGLLAPIAVLVPLQALVGTGSTGAEEQQGMPIADWVFTMVYGGFVWLGVFLLTGFWLHARDRWASGWTKPRARAASAAAVVAVLAGLAAAAGLDLTRLDDMTLVAYLGNLVFYAAAGLAVVLCRWGVAVRRGVPLLLGWVGSGAVATWGLYGLVLLVVPNDLVGDAPVAGLDVATQLVRTLAGVGAAVVVAWTVRAGDGQAENSMASSSTGALRSLRRSTK